VVVDAEGNVRWRVHAGFLVAFSPNGRQVLAVQTRRQLSVLRARDGSVVAQVDLPQGTDVSATVWETNRALLTLLRHKRHVAVVRAGLDGRITRATPAVRLNHGRSPYLVIPRS